MKKPPKPENAPETHWDFLKQLIELEEHEEILAFRDDFERLTPEEREIAGKALLRMRVSELHFSPEGHRLISFVYANAKPLPIYSPDPGDLISVSLAGEISDSPLIGTVYDKEGGRIVLAFREDLDDEAVEEHLLYDLNLSAGRSTYKKIYDTLRKVRSAKDDRLAFFRDLSLGLRKPESYDPPSIEKIIFFNDSLNRWQKEAVAKARASKDIFILHGPPGTGKTTTLVEIIRQAVEAGQFVFATAPSNTACDQLLESLVRGGVTALRLGHPARIMEHLRTHTIDARLIQHPLRKEADRLEQELMQIFKKKDRRRERRVLHREERAEVNLEIRRLKSEIRAVDHEVLDQVIRSASVLVGTHASGDHPWLKKKTLDLLIMDEASQAIEPMAWNPILRAQKVILAGDHLQLPPTVKSEEAARKGLAKTLFERFHHRLGDEFKSLLKIQYRMHEHIMNFSSRYFYKGELEADASVRHHVLADLSFVTRAPETEEALLFLDTAGAGFEEKMEPGSHSRFNAEEANLLILKLNGLLKLGVDPETVAVISPYSAQVRLLASKIRDKGIEIDSVDGFQGREKDVVFVSLVRSNCEGELGFLADTRRMNVAMTRARRKLIVIGDSGTLGSLPFYRSFMEYADSLNARRSYWEDIHEEGGQ